MQEKLQQLAILATLILSITTNQTNLFAVDEFDILKYKGFIAFRSAETVKSSNEKNLNVCSCNGTGKVKSGDGILLIDCPCQPNCNCKNIDLEKSSKCSNPDCKCSSCECVQTDCQSKWSKRILFFGFTNCVLCSKFKKYELPKLTEHKTNPWDYGTTSQNLIQYIDSESESGEKLVEHYSVDTYPTFIVIDKQGKELVRYEGFLSAKSLGDLYYNPK